MYLQLECTYCGKTWTEKFYYKESIKDVRCSVCKDKNLKIKEVKPEDRDPFGYNYQEKKRVPKT